MPTHFDAVGFPVAGRTEFAEVISEAYERAVSADAGVDHASGFTLTYRDPSGALLTMHVNRQRELICVQPSLDSDLRIRWRPQRIVPDESCAFCDLAYAERLEAGDEMVYPFAMCVESIGADRELIRFGEPAEARLVGLCESGQVWPDERAFNAAAETRIGDSERELRYGAQSFFPSGLLGETTTPHALVHGIVVSVEDRLNELGGGSFRVARLDTYGGQIDTCWATDQGNGLAPGAVARANLWLVGRPLTLSEP